MNDSTRHAICETYRCREKQVAYNEKHGITPAMVIRGIDDSLAIITNADYLELTSEDFTEVIDFTDQGRAGRLYRQTGDGNARFDEEV